MGPPSPPQPDPPSDADPERSSLFTEPDADELLTAADLDDSLPPSADPDPAGGELGSGGPTSGDEGNSGGDDAVDPAVAEASLAFVTAHGDDGPPPPEDDHATPAAWAIPWVISLLAHAALVIVAVFVVWSVRQALDDEEVIVPLVRLSETPGAPPLEVAAPQRLETPPPTPTPVPVPTPTPTESLLDIEIDLELPGLGDPAAATPPAFTPQLNDAAEFDTNFFGSGGNAREIVFVLEADGSIISDYPQIVDELAKSLRDMSEKQRFSVVVFDGQGVKEVPPRGLKRATADAKASTIAWLRDTRNVQNQGSGDSVAALQRAFRLEPELIFLLSQNLYNPGRGQYELQRDEVLDAVRKTSRRNIAINTIEFNDIDRLALDPSGRKVRLTLLEEIAQLTGGEYLWVVTNELEENVVLP
ncbi:MAG: hypothetical protein AAFX76_06160 [Planctomycetota bacterium]